VVGAALAASGCGDDPGSGEAEGGTASSSEGSSESTEGSGSASGSTTASGSGSPTSDSMSSGDPTTDGTDGGTDGGTDTTDPTTGIDEDVEVMELRANGFSPPVTETFYSCFSFPFTVDALSHIVGFVPQVTNPNVHHYVLSLVEGQVNLNPANECLLWPNNIMWAWAPGIEALMLPPEAGLLIGDAPGGEHTFILQVHYNNPLEQQIVDNDGLDVLITKELRPNPAAIFSQGDIAAISIPGNQSAYEHVASCAGNQTSSLLTEPIHVFASFLHAHEIGAAITSEVYRGGNMVGTIATEDPFDFNQQKFLPADIDIMPGDEIRTRCTYDSTGINGNTNGGEASDEEMCINFMMYYPRVGSQKCGSF
jgi:hypothetical protein